MGNPWLSVIIPAYNCERTIERVLNSIIMQGDPTVEVIICDDHSTDNFMEKVLRYNGLLDIKYVKTLPRKIHCPGNTRRDGWSIATGEWITFIDNDDEFEPFTFYSVKSWIEQTGEKRLISTKFRSWNIEKRAYSKEFEAITWMHGKFYNKQWLIDNKINFKEDLEANEDLYFNGLVNAALLKDNTTYTKADYFSYKWFEEPNSLSRKMHTKEGARGFCETHFEDYIFAASDPWISMYQNFKGYLSKESKENYFDKVCYIILHAYLYLQCFEFKWGKENILEENVRYFKDLIFKVKEVFKCKRDDIINHIYFYQEGKEFHYQNIKAAIENSEYPFIEAKSFLNFMVENIEGEEEKEDVKE